MRQNKVLPTAAALHPLPYGECFMLLGLAFALALVAPTAQAIEYEPFRLGAVEVIPNFNTSVTPTGSVLLPNGQEESSELLLFKPRVTAVVSGNKQRMSSTLEVQNGNYSAAGATGYIDWKLENTAHFQLDDTRSLNFRSENFNTHEGAGSTNPPRDEREAARFTLSTYNSSLEQSLWNSRGRLVVDGGRVSKTYSDLAGRTDLVNFADNHVGGSFRFRLLPSTNLQMQYRARDIDYELAHGGNGGAPVDRRELFSYIGATWEKQIDYVGNLRLTSGYKQTENQAAVNLANVATWETNLRWQPMAGSTLTFATDRSERELAGFGEEGTSSSYRYNWEHRWASQLKTTLAGSYSENVDARARRTDEGMGLKLRLDYAYSTWVDMFIALGHDRRKSGGHLNFTQQTFMLGIAASFDRFFGRK